jgi:menaquinone-dependent protoporphyrinogen oxidase
VLNRPARILSVLFPVLWHDIDAYDAYVIGSAAYVYHWLRDATTFVKRNRALLASRPVWLFSSGPLGTDLVDEKGRDVFEAARPKEFAELQTMVHPRGERVFFGAWDPDAPPAGMAERFLSHMPEAKAQLPAGDFRDWAAIDSWADEIADQLRKMTAERGVVGESQ